MVDMLPGRISAACPAVSLQAPAFPHALSKSFRVLGSAAAFGSRAV